MRNPQRLQDADLSEAYSRVACSSAFILHRWWQIQLQLQVTNVVDTVGPAVVAIKHKDGRGQVAAIFPSWITEGVSWCLDPWWPHFSWFDRGLEKCLVYGWKSWVIQDWQSFLATGERLRVQLGWLYCHQWSRAWCPNTCGPQQLSRTREKDTPCSHSEIYSSILWFWTGFIIPC